MTKSVPTHSQRSLRHMVWIPPGAFSMGSEDFYPEERPVHQRKVDGFWIDTHPVTNAEFRRFVKDTGHITTAETAPDPHDYPDASPDHLVPGSLVFTPPRHAVPLDDFRAWWSWVPGARWCHPEGPGSTLHGRELHPVTHVSYDDAVAYATWAGKELPTEPEWEYAARGGLDGATYAWGDEAKVNGRFMANTWQGEFPHQNLRSDGYDRTSPVGRFPPNGYGLVDSCGNVWEWTADPFTANHSATARPAPAAAAHRPCCGPASPRTPGDARESELSESSRGKVIKGGSHLCAPNYCLRYRPAARQSQTVDSSTSHLGFRCLVRADSAGGRIVGASPVGPTGSS